VQELQRRLTAMEADMRNDGQTECNLLGNSLELTLKKGEREKQLEVLVRYFWSMLSNRIYIY
jgi:hypothetical protein